MEMLPAKIKIMALRQAENQRIEAEIAALENELENHPMFQELQKKRETLKRNQAIYADLRDALQDYVIRNFTDNKHPHPALEVAEVKQISYEDEAVIRWAIQHDAPQLLKLDTKATNALARSPICPAVINVTTVLKIRLKQDLSEWK